MSTLVADSMMVAMGTSISPNWSEWWKFWARRKRISASRRWSRRSTRMATAAYLSVRLVYFYQLREIPLIFRT